MNVQRIIVHFHYFLYYAFSVQFAESIHKLSLCLSVRMYAIVVLRSKDIYIDKCDTNRNVMALWW